MKCTSLALIFFAGFCPGCVSWAVFDVQTGTRMVGREVRRVETVDQNTPVECALTNDVHPETLDVAATCSSRHRIFRNTVYRIEYLDNQHFIRSPDGKYHYTFFFLGDTRKIESAEFGKYCLVNMLLVIPSAGISLVAAVGDWVSLPFRLISPSERRSEIVNESVIASDTVEHQSHPYSHIECGSARYDFTGDSASVRFDRLLNRAAWQSVYDCSIHARDPQAPPVRYPLRIYDMLSSPAIVEYVRRNQPALKSQIFRLIAGGEAYLDRHPAADLSPLPEISRKLIAGLLRALAVSDPDFADLVQNADAVESCSTRYECRSGLSNALARLRL